MRTPIGRAARVAVALIVVGASGRGAIGADGPAPPVGPSRAVAAVAPEVPPEVVAALQGGRYPEAIAALDRLGGEAKDLPVRSYLALVKGTAERLARRPDAARLTWSDALKADPGGVWAPKVRYELAGVELAAGRTSAAEALARVEADRLLAGDRKDRLAEVYFAFARRLLKPDDPVTPADPAGARALLDQARGLAKGPALIAALRLEMARAASAAGNRALALADYQAYLAEPGATERPAALYGVGESQLLLGQLLPARLTFTDLAAELDKAPGRDRKDAASIRARALYQVAMTHGIPGPPDDTQLNLGVAALGRFLAAYPADPWAVRASYQIGASYLARGKSEQALAALAAFLAGRDYRAEADEARRDLASLAMTATFQVAEVLRSQQKFAEAIAAWQGYLAKYPNGPQSADAQRAILDAQLLAAADALRREKYPEARADWLAFVARNPLDARVPQLLFQVGASFVAQNDFDGAIAAWEPLLSKFPGSEPAAHAQFDVASIYETHKGDPAQAIERYRKVAAQPWQNQAAHRVALMESRELTVVTPRTFRSGETPHLKVSTRNLEALTFRAYRLNAEAYFRKKQALGLVESLDIGLVAADAEWTVPVAGYGKYKPLESAYDLKVKAPGVWVVKVSDETHLQATTLVLGSDLDAIVKVSRDQLLVFAQDMKTGRGRPNARVLVSDGSGVILEKKTGDDGVMLASWKKPRDPDSALHYLVLDGGDAAGTGLGVPGQVAQGLSARAYIYTDRPAYRPGGTVGLRGVVREARDGQYANPAGETYRLEVFDSRGRLLVARPAKLSEFGTFHETVALDGSAPVGSYRVRLFQPGKSEFAGAFEVQSYHLEKLDLAFDLPRTVYFRNETVKADVVAKYQYGAPVAQRAIEVTLPDGRTLRGLTDAAGKYHVEFSTAGFAEEQTLRMVARLPQDNVGASADVSVAIRAFRIDLATTRDTYLDGETFRVKVDSVDAQGKPTGQPLTLAVLKRIEQAGSVAEREVSSQRVATDPKTGEAAAPVRVDDADGGVFVVRASGTDRFGNAILADRVLTISGKRDETRLRILADRVAFKVGETAQVRLHSRVPSGPALVSWEADRVIQYRIVDLQEGENLLTWAVEGPQFPNFTLNAARMSGTRFDEARLDVRVERELVVSLRPKKPTVLPGEEVEVEVTAVDGLGRPAAAELSVALVDRSLLRLYGDDQTPIGPYFYDQTRTGSFATSSTNTFRYDPTTGPVAEAVVEEQARAAALADNSREREGVRQEGRRSIIKDLRSRLDLRAPAAPGPYSTLINPYPTQSMAAAPMGRAGGRQGGMGGGMGGVGDKLGEINAPAGEQESQKKKGMHRSYDVVERDGVKADMYGNDLGLPGQAGPRERFVETAYWNPAVVTGADGKATVKFKAPNALSEYRFSARGVTGSDTLVGQATAELVVRKDFFVDLKAPDALTQGDRPRFIGQVHHLGVEGPVAVSLTVYAGDRQEVYPKVLTIKGDGVDEVMFDPFEVPEGESVRLTIRAQVGEKADELTVEVPIRPWGVQAYATASGTSTDSTTVFVGLPPGRPYENADMLVTISPTLRRLLIELALGGEAVGPYTKSRRIVPCPMLPLTIADRAGELVAASAALDYLRRAKSDQAPEASRLAARIQALAAELITTQGDDGGWPWVAPAGGDARKHPSDRMTSAMAARGLASARALGLLTDPGAVDRVVTYLRNEQPRIEAGDLEMKVMVQYSLALLGQGSFEAANALSRARQSLPDAALAELALTLAALDRPTLADELVGILAGHARNELIAGEKPRKFWAGDNQVWHRGRAETTAVVALAYTTVRPGSADLAGAVDWLLANRAGDGWQPHKAKGPALAALAKYYGQAQAAEDRYRLVVTVNDQEVYRADVRGAAEGKGVFVPRKALKVGDRNRVRFEVEGRGTFGYSVALTGFARDLGPEQDGAGKTFTINDRSYLPAEPEVDGKALPTGFGVAVNPRPFTNKITQLGLGGRARVHVQTGRSYRADRHPWERDFLIVEETLPAGTTLIEGSLSSQATNHTLADGVLTLYFAPGTYTGTIQYDIFGYLPGQYRAAPTRIRSAYEPGRQHLGPSGDLKVLPAGERPADPYRATPDELYARGKAHFNAGRLAEAEAPLEELSAGNTLRDDVLKDTSRMLLTIHIKDYQARKVVQDFEVLKEKAPELVIPFDEVAVIGRAYRDIGEHERAYLVWRAIVEASYLEDAQVGETLRRRGRTLDAAAYLLDLWREYPGTASIEADLFGLSQLLAVAAGRAIDDPTLRAELAGAGVTRSGLILQAIRLDQVALTLAPSGPMADEVSLAQVGGFLELEDYESVVRLSERFAGLYKASGFLDSFQYSEALGRFNLGQYDRAIEVARAISTATYKDPNGVDQPSPNKWQAIYILGQIYDARRQPAKAVDYYKQVADRFTDASGAVKGLTRKDLKLPEVSLVRPGLKVAASPRPARARTVSDAPKVADKPTVELDYRNIPEADVKVYPVDLMRLYLTRRNLDAIAGVDLAGITPLFETTVRLGDGLDFADKVRAIDLPLDKEGAYLVMVRGENLYASGIVLVSPLELEVLEEAEAGRVRVNVRDARTKDPAAKVSVKVIGSQNPAFFSGQTDLRGVFVAEGVRGEVTAVARRDPAQYAFYRGKTAVGMPIAVPAPNWSATPPAPKEPNAPAGTEGRGDDLGKNVRQQNLDNQNRAVDRLQNRYKDGRKGIIIQEAK